MGTKTSGTFRRICDCEDSKAFQKGEPGKRPKLSCISAKDWLKSMMEVQEFFYTKQDIRDKSIHPSMFPVQLPEFYIKLMTHPGELVLDPFGGLGTTGVAGWNLGRPTICFDIEPRYVMDSFVRFGKLTKKKPKKGEIRFPPAVFVLDSTDPKRGELEDLLEPNSIKLIVTSPPYANILTTARSNKSRRTEDRKKDKHLHGEALQPISQGNIGLLEPTQWTKRLAQTFRVLYDYMHPYGHVIINISDVYSKETGRIFLAGLVAPALQNHTETGKGYILKNIQIWDKRKLINRANCFGWPSNFISMSVSSEWLLHFEVVK